MNKNKIKEYVKELQKEICYKQCPYEIDYEICSKCKFHIITNKILDELNGE